MSLYTTPPTYMLFCNEYGQVCFEAADAHFEEGQLILDKCFMHSYPRPQPEEIKERTEIDLDNILYISFHHAPEGSYWSLWEDESMSYA